MTFELYSSLAFLCQHNLSAVVKMIPVKGTQRACQVFKENTLYSPQSICDCWVFAVVADCHIDLSGEYTSVQHTSILSNI